MDQKEIIAQKIIEDATLSAQKTTDNANLKASELILQAEKLASERVESAREIAKTEGEKLIERRNTIARLDAKKQILIAKQSLIDEVFESAKQMLKGMGEEQYLEFVLKQIEKHAENGDKILLSSSAPFSAEKLEGYEFCVKLGLTVQNSNAFDGGIIIVGAKKDMDLTFDSIVKGQKEEFAGEVARKLFGENE